MIELARYEWWNGTQHEPGAQHEMTSYLGVTTDCRECKNKERKKQGKEKPGKTYKLSSNLSTNRQKVGDKCVQ